MLNPETITLIQEQRDVADNLGRLSDTMLEEVFRQRWFYIWVPKEYNGMNLPLADGCRLLESLAYWDGSLAWTVTLCAGANMFAGFIDPTIAQHIFSSGTACFGGSGRSTGRAIPVEGGFRLSGRWSYATGAPHLTHFTCNAVIEHADLTTSGEAPVKSFFVPRDQVIVDPDWSAFGLEATASHSFELHDAFVPTTYTFELEPDKATHTGLLFQFPFMPFAECTLFVNYLGMFTRYCDLVQKSFFLRAQDQTWLDQQGKRYFKELDQAQQLAENSRTYLYNGMQEAWDNLNNSKDNQAIYEVIGQRTRADLAIMRNLILNLHTRCGMAAARKEGELNSIFRNFLTATQHALLQSEA